MSSRTAEYDETNYIPPHIPTRNRIPPMVAPNETFLEYVTTDLVSARFLAWLRGTFRNKEAVQPELDTE